MSLDKSTVWFTTQEKSAEKDVIKIKQKLEKAEKEPKRILKEEKKKQQQEIKEIKEDQHRLKIKFKINEERRTKVKNATKEMGKIHHPINLKTGVLQTATLMKTLFGEQFKVIRECSQKAQLSESSMNRIEKAKRAFDLIVDFLKYFFSIYFAHVNNLQLSDEQKEFFNSVIFPLCYLKMI